ncbi:MAG TPA: hypothetical protein VN871_04710 [Mycobacterium sp.]|nr:hypothetical protein [Mycobacterium sp.]
MSDRIRSAVLRRAMLVCFGVAALGCALPAWAAAAAPTPASFTNCGGSVSRDKSGATAGEPNLLDYKFRCNGDISSYTIIANQQGNPGGSLDDFDPSPGVLESNGVTPNPTASITCGGVTPSNGINCNLGAGGVLPTANFAAGSIDLLQPFCKHLPTKAKAGTPAVPQALVQLVVTDTTGAEDGPFQLRAAKACPKVPNFAPATKSSKKQGKVHKGKRSRARH